MSIFDLGNSYHFCFAFEFATVTVGYLIRSTDRGKNFRTRARMSHYMASRQDQESKHAERHQNEATHGFSFRLIEKD